MDTSRNDLLGEIARDAELERSDFLVQATEQLNKFLKSNRERIAELGGLTLIDDDPDYLSIAQAVASLVLGVTGLFVIFNGPIVK